MNARRPPAADVRPAILAAALLLGQQVAARATRDALFLSAFPIGALPFMTAAAALFSLAATFAASRAAARRSPARLLPAALVASAAVFLAEWALALFAPRAAAVAVYLHHAMLGAVLVSGFWLLVTERFDPYTARHAMGAIGAGASLGGVAGGVVTWVAATGVPPAAMLGVLAATSVAGTFSVRALAAGARRGAGSARAVEAAEARSGLRAIRRAPLLVSLSVLVVVASFLDVVLDYLLAAAATQQVGTGAPLMSFFAAFHAATGLVGLAVQLTLVGPLLARLGPAWTLAAPSVVTAAGALAALFAPGLAAIVVVRGAHATLRHSAGRSGYELLYTPLPEALKRPAKVVVDVALDRVGSIAGSAAVMGVLLAAGAQAGPVLVGLAAIAAIAASALTPALRRGYVGALAGTLRAGSEPPESLTIVDPTSLLPVASIVGAASSLFRDGARPAEAPSADPMMQAIADLRSGDPRRIVPVLDRPSLDPRLVPHVIALLARDSLKDKLIPSLRRASERSTGQLVDALLDTRREPEVRRRVARVLGGVATQRSADGLLLALAAEDDRFDVRYRCAPALLRVRRQNAGVTVPAAQLLQLATRAAVRAGDSPRHLGHCFTLLAILLDDPLLESALGALRSGDVATRGTALEYLDNVLPAEVREPLWPHLATTSAIPRSGRSPDELRDDLERSTVMRRPER